jgi:hypothetical protein
MQSKAVTFVNQEWFSTLGDYDKFLIEYTIVDAQFVDEADEAEHTKRQSVNVKISRSLKNSWGLEKTKLERVLLEYVYRHIKDKIQDNSLSEKEEITLFTYTAPPQCPYDPDKITIIFGKRYEIYDNRPIGFRTK